MYKAGNENVINIITHSKNVKNPVSESDCIITGPRDNYSL